MGQERGFLEARCRQEPPWQLLEKPVRPKEELRPFGDGEEADVDMMEELLGDFAEEEEEGDKEQHVEPELKEKEDEENALGQEEAAEDKEHGEEEGEEGRAAKRLPKPQKVSKIEREEHELTHTPYRSWCKYCVRGRGQNMPHMRVKDAKEDGGVPIISMDYFFFYEQGGRGGA